MFASGFMTSFGQECDLEPSDAPCRGQDRKSGAPYGRESRDRVFSSRGVTRFFSVMVAGMLAGMAPLHAADISADSMMPEKPGPEIMAILDHFPAGSIDSVMKADRVLEVVRIEKANIKARLYNEKLECNKKFFVNWCYEEAEERQRIDSQALHMLEVEAKRFKRSDDIRQRDLAADERRAESEADALQRAENVAAHEARVKRVQERAARQAAAARGETATPEARHEGNLMTPAEKAENVREYEAKQKEAIKRQERVRQKRAETQQKRDRKAAEEAADK